MPAIRALAACAAATLCLLAAPRAAAQPPPADPQAATQDAATIFRDLLTRYYQACERKDLPAVEALWHPAGPARGVRNVLALQFETRAQALVGLEIVEAGIDPGGGRARALVDLSVTDNRTGRTYRERRVRDVTFLQDGTAWKIWNEGGGGAGARIAERLLAAPLNQRAALIATDGETRSDDTLAGLAVHAGRLRTEGRLGEVLNAFLVLAELARALDNQPILASGLSDAGLVYQVLGRQDEAARAFTEARELFTRVGTKAEVAVTDVNLGAVDYLRADYEIAAAHYQRALEAFEALQDAPRTGSTLHGLGNAHFMLGDIEQALACYQRSLGIHEAAGDGYSTSRVLEAIARAHKEVGSHAAAIEAYRRSAAIGAAAGDHVGVARAHHGLGEVCRLDGDYGRALQHFAASLASWEKTPDSPNRASTMFATGQVRALQRQFVRAVDWYRRALDIDRKAGDRDGVARDLGGLGGAHFAQSQFDAALGEYRESLAIREELNDEAGVMWTVVHLGVLHTAMGRHSEALEAYRRALTLAEAAGDAGAACTILALRGANELLRGDLEAALDSSAKAAEMAARLELFDVLGYARTVAGKAHRRAGRPDESDAALREAVAAVERIPVGPGVETFFDDRRGPYLALVDLLATDARAADAFLWSERARTRALAALLGEGGALVRKGLTDEERDHEQRLARDARALAVRLGRERGRAKPDEDRIARVRQDLDRVKTEQAALRRALVEKHEGLAVLRAQAEPVGADAAARVLRPSEALVSFVVSESTTRVFVVSRGRSSQSEAPLTVTAIDVKQADLRSRVAALRDAVVRRDAGATSAARELYSLLITPIRSAIAEGRSLVIVPDDSLWQLPFEALMSGSGRYLVQDYAIAYAPSLTALAAMRSAEVGSRARPTLVAAADPVVSAQATEQLAMMLPESHRPAPRAAREAREISAVFGSPFSRTLVGPEARLDRIAAAVRPGGAVHLAVPGALLDSSPLYSLLALTPSGRDDTGEGRIETGDVVNWTLPAELVVLPRVEPAAGSAGGEALVALAWAFHVAGSPTTVVSRWPPSERATGSLAIGFYRAWLARATPRAARPTAAEALQRAARSLIARPDSHPADWAALMAIGR